MSDTPESIAWYLENVRAGDIIPNPQNPKIKTRKGIENLNTSLRKFGDVFDCILNADNRIIDGHSRYEKKASDPDALCICFKPSRLLDEKEYSEMNAFFDVARAGEVSMSILEKLFTEDVFNEWQMEHPDSHKKGGNAIAQYPIIPEADERYELIVIVCTNQIDHTYIKNALSIGQMQSYKKKTVAESNVITAEHFIKRWEAQNALPAIPEEPKHTEP